MLDLPQLKDKIRGRSCAIIAHGKSIEELETRIHEFASYDICWIGLGQFDTIERYILHPAGMYFDIVFDCATVPESKMKNYENKQRMPRLESFLSQSTDRMWVTTHGIYRDTIKALHFDSFWNQFEKQVMMVDSLFPRDGIEQYMEVPNSLTLACSIPIAGGAKNIILFGCDGYIGPTDTGESILTYYKPEEVKKERMAALGSIEDPGINRDTRLFEKMFKDCYLRYGTLFNCIPDIYNCSPNTLYSHIRKINYDEAKNILEGQTLDPVRGDGWSLLY
jgi:hypothetical protein